MKLFSSLMLNHFRSRLSWKFSWTPPHKWSPLFQWTWARLNFPLQKSLPWCTAGHETWFTGGTLIEIGVLSRLVFLLSFAIIIISIIIIIIIIIIIMVIIILFNFENMSIIFRNIWCKNLKALYNIKNYIHLLLFITRKSAIICVKRLPIMRRYIH